MSTVPIPEAVRAWLGETPSMIIDGAWVRAAWGQAVDTQDPATGLAITTVPLGDARDVDTAITAARRALGDGLLRPQRIISERVTLEEVPDAYGRLDRRETTKVIIKLPAKHAVRRPGSRPETTATASISGRSVKWLIGLTGRWRSSAVPPAVRARPRPDVAAEGAKVVIGDIRKEQLQKLAGELDASEHDVIAMDLDVTEEAAWAAAVESAQTRFGKLDVLVNNAGILSMAGVEATSREVWDRVVAVNQTGVWLGMKTAAPAIRQAGGGSIINISSIYGLIGSGAATRGPRARSGCSPRQRRSRSRCGALRRVSP